MSINVSQSNFNDKVVSYIRQNELPDSLNDLLIKMKTLSDGRNVTTSDLNSALLSADTALRSDPDYSASAKESLDQYTTQLLGINMLVNKMLTELISPKKSDDDDSESF